MVVDNGDVFSEKSEDPVALRWLTKLANGAHVRTSAGFIRSELLFAEGECLDSLRLGETQRLLSGYSFLRSARIVTENFQGDDVTVRVETRDEWSSRLNAGLGFDGRANLEGLDVTEVNFLGRGIRARAKYYDYRERREFRYSLASPRLFGRTDGLVSYSRTRAGDAFHQAFSYPFLGDSGGYAVSEQSGRGFEQITYAANADSPFSHVQVPVERGFAEITGARRVGPVQRSAVFGVSVSHEWRRVTGPRQIVERADFDRTRPLPSELEDEIQRQTADESKTLVALHAVIRKLRYEEMEGLDGVRDVQIVDLGAMAALSLAQEIGRTPDGRRDQFARIYGIGGRRYGESMVYGSVLGRAAFEAGKWHDILVGADVAGYGRARWAPAQTFFVRLSAAGGWQTLDAHQLTLGGRDGVRSLGNDELPGGGRVVVVAEDRFRLGWPNTEAADIGLTILADVGRTWAMSAPFGVNSAWMASAGVGLRIGVPRGTRNILRPDIVFPVGRRGRPVFRITYEMNRYSSRFGTPKFGSAQWRLRGAESL